ncbi:hypothetical protein FIU87_11790 [Bacillus sp. THAF10]|nr:hypothetical protein FIU87_11790 [Bacillus sp. THAF10]
MTWIFVGATIVTYSVLMKAVLKQTCEPNSVK